MKPEELVQGKDYLWKWGQYVYEGTFQVDEQPDLIRYCFREVYYDIIYVFYPKHLEEMILKEINYFK